MFPPIQKLKWSLQCCIMVRNCFCSDMSEWSTHVVGPDVATTEAWKAETFCKGCSCHCPPWRDEAKILWTSNVWMSLSPKYLNFFGWDVGQEIRRIFISCVHLVRITTSMSLLTVLWCLCFLVASVNVKMHRNVKRKKVSQTFPVFCIIAADSYLT